MPCGEGLHFGYERDTRRIDAQRGPRSDLSPASSAGWMSDMVIFRRGQACAGEHHLFSSSPPPRMAADIPRTLSNCPPAPALSETKALLASLAPQLASEADAGVMSSVPTW